MYGDQTPGDASGLTDRNLAVLILGALNPHLAARLSAKLPPLLRPEPSKPPHSAPPPPAETAGSPAAAAKHSFTTSEQRPRPLETTGFHSPTPAPGAPPASPAPAIGEIDGSPGLEVGWK